MEQLTNILTLGFNEYISTLKEYGKVKDSTINILLILSYIQELLTNNSIYLLEEEYKVFDKVLYELLKKQCLIPYPKYYHYVQTTSKKFIVRMTENSIIKMDDLGNIRKV